MQHIRMELRDREIQVTDSPDEQMHVIFYENTKEYYDLTYPAKDTLEIQWVSNKSWLDYIGGKAPEHARTVILQVPQTSLETLQLFTTNGDIVMGNTAITRSITLESNGGDILLEGEVPSPINPPLGCNFCTRCRYADERCRTEEPPFLDVGGGHFVACHRVNEEA